jgi:hypothetical protein
MATEAQINANRQNAHSSTGPRTDAGKASSSRNHLTLGLYTRTDYVKPEERDFYKEFCETMYLDLAPAGLLEECLASEITGASWRLRRCSSAEGELGDFDEATDKMRRSIERARASASSLLHRGINQLRKLRKERVARPEPKPQPQPESQADPLVDQLNLALDSIMNCPEPDWDGIGLGLNCEPEPAPEPKTASICKPAATEALQAALTKRSSLCACKSGKIYRNCCGKNEPGDWRKAA